LDRLEKGEYGPMWTKTGEAKLKTLLDLNRTVQKGVLEELRSTQIPEVET
jgi:hypothetical protein